jgi:GNAT superfamily N-acetyltransferase
MTSRTELEFRAVEAATWSDFARLFESRGGPKTCWCMLWRPGGTRRVAPARRKAMMEEQVRGGVPVGILGYRDGEPVAWCSIAPRTTYRDLGGPGEAHDGAVWSLACMFVKRSLRGQGIGARLICAAVDHARRRGAAVVEAYPVDAGSPSYRFMGVVAAFERAGFREVGRAGTRRHVMRKDVAEH